MRITTERLLEIRVDGFKEEPVDANGFGPERQFTPTRLVVRIRDGEMDEVRLTGAIVSPTWIFGPGKWAARSYFRTPEMASHRKGALLHELPEWAKIIVVQCLREARVMA